MINIVARIGLTVLIIIVALGIGLLLRRAVVRSLKDSVLDDWLVQTLGALVMLPLLIVAALASPIIIAWDINKLTDVLERLFPNASTQDIKSFVLNLFWTLVIILLALGLARTLMRLIVRSLGESRMDINLRILLGRIFYIIVLVLAFFWILSLWEPALTVPVTVLGVATVVFSIAIQDVVKDLVAGFYILIEHPFRIGDQISTANYTGRVQDVQLRATKLRIVSGEEVTIPNSLVFSGVVINNTFYDERRATISVTLAQDEFVEDETSKLILKALKGIKDVMAKPEPRVTVSSMTGAVSGYVGTASGYTGKAVTLTVRFWIASGQLTTVSEVMFRLRDALPTADLVVRESAGDV
jgi:small-conductance mechanosensitive channel